MSDIHSRPRQRIPKSQKTPEWYEANGRYYRGACQPAIDEAEALRMYRLANGEFDEMEYTHVTNPINTNRSELMGYPAKMRNYDIISPNVNLLMGEKAKRRFHPIVYAKNYNKDQSQGEFLKQLLIKNLQQQFINNAIAMGAPLDEETITDTFDTITRKVKSIPDVLSKNGQDALDFIIDYNDLFREHRKGFYDWICNAMSYYYNDVIRDRTHFEIISPINISYLCNPHHDFIEDGEAVKVTHKLSANEIYDRFQHDDDFKKNKELQEFLDKFEDGTYGGDSHRLTYSFTDAYYAQYELYRTVFNNLPESDYSKGIQVDHIVWRSSTKVGKVEISDIFGNKEIIYVDETFKDPTGQYNVEWEWVDEICEIYCIADRYYINGRPIPIQRGEYNRPNKAKLLYNGRNMFSRHTRPTSIVKKGEAYQKAVNIIKYRAEESLLKSLDKVILFPLGLIPKKEGWDETKLMYYVRAFSFLFFDDTRPNAAAMVSALKDMNLSMGEHILRSFELVAAIKQEYDDLCGINRQRKSNIMASDGKATSEYALNQSYIMSEEMFLEYEELERRSYIGLLELSKFAFSDGIYAQFTRTDGQKGFLNIIDPASYVNTDFGVFVRNGAEELQKLNTMKAQVQPLIQNGANPKAIVGLVESNNFVAIHEIMDELDERMQANLEQDRQMQLELQASKERMVDKQLEQKYYSDELASATDIQVALIQQGMEVANRMAQMEQSGQTGTDEYGMARVELEKNAIELMKNATKLKEIASKERIAMDNNKTKLKNKVVGEK